MSSQQIVFERSRDSENFAVIVARPDLTGQRQIWSDRSAPSSWGRVEDVFSVHFRPDGRKVVFTAWFDKPKDGRGVIPRSILVDVDGTSRARTIGLPGDEYPTFSPDGRCLAFVRSGSIFVTSADGRSSAVRVAAGLGLEAPAWSPDGRRIAYTAPRPDNGSESYDTSVVASTRADGRGDTRSWTEYRRGVIDGDPVYSPDGRTIAFERYEESFGDDPQAWTMPAGGGAATRLSHGDQRESVLTFSPNGKRLIFSEYILIDRYVEEGGGSYELVSANLDGSDRRRLTHTLDEIDEGCWSWIGPA